MSSSAPVKPKWSAPLLRVLSGLQTGAQAPMRQERLLVGNLQTECDVVLDVGRSEPHSCLIRASADGWTVLSIAGDLWAGEEWVSPQQVHEIRSGTVLTLGGVAFCLADPATIDWSHIEVPANRSLPEPAPNSPSRSSGGAREAPAPRAPILQTLPALLARLRSMAIAGTVSVAVMALAGFGVSTLYAAAASSESSATSPSRPAEVAQAAIKSYPWARELTTQPDPHHVHRVLVGGYLPEHQQASVLESTLRGQGIELESRWAAVDELRTDLARHLGLPDSAAAAELRYTGQGAFVLSASNEHFETLNKLTRRALQDLPAVHSLELQLPDRSSPAGATPGNRSPVVIRYERAEGSPSGVSVSGLERLRPTQELQRLEITEMRNGALPSIVLDNGTRYFEGSSLPGGAVLVKVWPDHLTVRVGDELRRIGLGGGASILVKKST